MNCPECRFSNPPSATHCEKCGTSFPQDEGATYIRSGMEGWSAGVPEAGAPATTGSTPLLQPGSVLTERYQILELLGEGGMGAVYKARDRAVDRLVALKVIHAELAWRPEILQRFKHELILARQVTHQNVIRLFDLGADHDWKFITMEYVDGQDLASLLSQKGKFTPEETTIPRFMSDLAVKCLQMDPERRYQSALEILQVLEAPRTPEATTPHRPHRLRERRRIAA